MTKSPHPSSVDKGELLALGYRVVDVKNEHVESGWLAIWAGDPSRVVITATEDEAWQWAADHAASAKRELLPVTQADRNAAADAYAMRRFGDGDEREQAEAIRTGLCDHWDVVQAFARHRQAHSLPGDVGMRERDRWTLEELLDDVEDEWIDHYLRPDSAERAKCKRCGGDDFFKSSIEHKPGCLVGRIRAALTPSALSEEMAGHDLIPEGEHARALTEVARLQRLLVEIGDDLKAMPFSNNGDKLGRWHLALIGKVHDVSALSGDAGEGE